MGVATIVQGTIVQGDSCPRDFCPMTQLSKETIVQWDFCPRKLLPVKSLFKLFFLIFYWKLPHSLIIEYKKSNVSSLIFVNSYLGQKSPWTKVCLDNCPLDKSLLGQLVPWTIAPWTIVATPPRDEEKLSPF